MTTDEIIDTGHKAGTLFITQCGVASVTVEWLENFAALIATAKDAEHQQTLALQQRSYEREIEIEVEAEREACAKLAESTICDTHLPTGVRIYGTRVADAIRARETHETTPSHKEDNAKTTSLQRRRITPPYAIGVASEGASRKT